MLGMFYFRLWKLQRDRRESTSILTIFCWWWAYISWPFIAAKHGVNSLSSFGLARIAKQRDPNDTSKLVACTLQTRYLPDGVGSKGDTWFRRPVGYCSLSRLRNSVLICLIFLALSQRLSLLGLIFRSSTPTSGKIILVNFRISLLEYIELIKHYFEHYAFLKLLYL